MQLRFSKTGNEYMGKLYANHYVKNKPEFKWEGDRLYLSGPVR